MLFQVLCGFEPIFYTTHPNEEPKIGMKCVLVDRNSICEKNICKIKNLYEIHNVLLNDIGQYNTELSIRSSVQ